MQALTEHMQKAANMARSGNVQQLVQMTLQQNPQLAQKYNMLMQQCPNMSPPQVLSMLTQQLGIDISKLYR
jgi:hypothetical protein